MKIHHGQNIKRLREFLGLKQDALAFELGENCNQKKVSLLEQKELVDPQIVSTIADFFQISEIALKQFDAKTVLQCIDNEFSNKKTFSDNMIEPLDNVESATVDRYCQEKLTLTEMAVKLYHERNSLYREMLHENEKLINWLKKCIDT